MTLHIECLSRLRRNKTNNVYHSVKIFRSLQIQNFAWRVVKLNIARLLRLDRLDVFTFDLGSRCFPHIIGQQREPVNLVLRYYVPIKPLPFLTFHWVSKALSIEVGIPHRALPRYQSEKIKILNTLFPLWKSKPQPIVLTATHLCPCAKKGLSSNLFYQIEA